MRVGVSASADAHVDTLLKTCHTNACGMSSSHCVQIATPDLTPHSLTIQDNTCGTQATYPWYKELHEQINLTHG